MKAPRDPAPPRRFRDTAEILASFGAAQLMRHRSGALELRAGSPADRAAALDWCELVLPEAAFLCVAPENPPAPQTPPLAPIARAKIDSG